MSDLITKKFSSGTVGFHWVSAEFKPWYFSPFTGGKVRYFDTEEQARAYGKRHADKLAKEGKQ